MMQTIGCVQWSQFFTSNRLMAMSARGRDRARFGSLCVPNKWGAFLLFCLAAAITAPAQTFKLLDTFDEANGANPNHMSLVQGLDGNLYGTTNNGGANGVGVGGDGTVFKISPKGGLTTLYSFCSQTNCTDGSGPYAGLVQATDGNLYGSTGAGGSGSSSFCIGCGTIFRISPGGALTTLYNFCSQPNCADGSSPLAAMVQAADGNLYGVTGSTVFRVSLAGKLTTLYTFCSQTGCSDGTLPVGLIQALDGNFYGATNGGGGASTICPGGCGTVFKITPAGALTTFTASAPKLSAPTAADRMRA